MMLFSLLGFGVLLWRLTPVLKSRLWPSRELKTAGEDATDTVTIIVPARNEEANIERILNSLVAIEHESLEIIVVNDASTDRTREIADAFVSRTPTSSRLRIRVVDAPAKPVGWVGKTWACEHGASLASGEFLLFTDADTTHLPSGLRRAIWKMKAEQLDMLSAVPFHESESGIETLMGPFHTLVLIGSSGFSKPHPRALFAIGQYLLFRRESYLKIGRHECVRGSFSEDYDLAARTFAEGLRYGLDRSGEIFKVRMYATLVEFIAGWRRIFRIGFPHASLWRAVEVFLVIACLMASFHFRNATLPETLMAIAGLLMIAGAQGRYGRFSFFGVIVAPLGIGTFVAVTGLALFDRLRGADLRWRGRSYKVDL